MRELRALDEFDPGDLTRRQRLLVAYAVGLVSVVLCFTLVYYWGMRSLEGRPRSIFQAFNTVIETMTTTGYGADSPWSTWPMNVFVATMQVSGVLIGFITLRVLVIPLFERTPLNLDDRLSIKDDHVVVAEYQRDTEVLLEELEELDVDYVLLESDEEQAKKLSDDGYQAINGNPERRVDLDRATIDRASLLITDTGDTTASVVLTALEANEELTVVSFTESTRRKPALAQIGVDRSVSPHALIGQRLAEKATTPITVEGASEADSVGIREILIRRGSPLHGVRVRHSPLADHPDLTLVAGWFDGSLRLPPSGDDRLTHNTVLVVAGPERELDELSTEVARVRSPRGLLHSRVVVAGLGEGGSAAVDALPERTSVTTIDESAPKEPDIVGDVTEPETLQAAEIEDASALVVTVGDDSTALLTIAMARWLGTELEILVRVVDDEKVSAAFRAGADYVLSVQRTCARLVAAEVHGERVVDPVSQIRLIRADTGRFVDQSLADARRSPGRQWTVVGLSRDGTVYTDGTTVIQPDDEIFVAGSDEAIQEFERAMDD